MALFSKLNNQINVNKIKSEKVETTLIENELIFGELTTLVEDVYAIDNDEDDLLKSIRSEGERNSDAPNVNKDINHDGNSDPELIPRPGMDKDIPLAAEVFDGIEVK